ncbi:MAG: response regulator [Elusimicrobiaceae bacterium]|nr:response regulator [Elusimicrobiaceae bacterium]
MEKHKVLIVDDSPILRSTIRNVLERNGKYLAVEAGNAADALEQFKKESPELVLLDILLPGESGLDILKELVGVNPTAKVLMLTAINQEAVNLEARDLGAKGIVYKPFEPDELLEAIEKILE